MNDNKKRKGGAERDREKNKKLMLSGKKCVKLDLYFCKNNLNTALDAENISGHNDLSFDTDHISHGKLFIKLFYHNII